MGHQEHVRLMVALFAAVSLHALMFAAFSSHENLAMSVPEGSMRLDLLPGPKSVEHKTVEHKAAQPRAAAEPARQQTSKDKAQPAPRRVVRQHSPASPVKVLVAAQPPARQQQASAAKSTVQPKAVPPAIHSAPGSEGGHAPLAAPGVVPPDIRQRIMAAVHYPRLARLQGWQGRAEFQINVVRQGIHAVTLLSSTGYPLLDRAAEQGIVSVGRIPLSNGLYRMPVIFVLR